MYNLAELIRREKRKALTVAEVCPMSLVRRLHFFLPRVLASSHYYHHQTFLTITKV